MKNKKINTAAELGKSFIMGLVPITLIRLVMKLNFQITNAFINSIVMVCLVELIFVLRTKTKECANNDIPILLLTIIFFPAGLYYLWKYSKRTRIVKIVATLFVVCLLMLGKFIAG